MPQFFMEKKGIIVLSLMLIVSIMFLSLVSSQSVNASAVDKAYKCLNDEISNRTSLNLEQASFAGMAIGGKTNIVKTLKDNKDALGCWPKGKCTIKDTAQAILASKRSGEKYDDAQKWLISKSSNPTELVWYLEIDIKDRTSARCTIRYENKAGNIEINEDMTLSRNTAGECFSISENLYWLKLNPSCISKEFEISCNNDFLSALIYQKRNGETIYVSSEASSSSANSSTKEKVEAKCFKTESLCDYEGTLWATLALLKTGEDIKPYLPYLSALSDDNTRYFPSAFLFMFSASGESSEYYTDIIQKQNSKNIWEIAGSRYKKFYDSSLAMLALSSISSSSELERAKSSLTTMQKSNGCWSERDSIIDTSFVLFSGWQRTSSGGGSSNVERCTSVSSQSCEIKEDCLDAGGSVLTNYDCSGGSVCCSVKVPEKTCSQLQGVICKSGEDCSSLEIVG